MTATLKIALIQTTLHWEYPDRNFQHFDEILNSLSESTDIIVLPEMFTTAFSMEPEKLTTGLLEKTLEWMHRQATKYNAVVTGSTMCIDKSIFYNRLIWMLPDGTYKYYDKRHLFSYGNEPQHYTSGNNRLIVEYKGWRLCPLICYDLRFPAWCRNTVDYDLLLFVANWPNRRVFAWKQLLIARAIENVCYVAGVNRIGNDGNNIYHSGYSSVIDYLGNTLWTEADREAIHTVTLDKKPLIDFRKTFTALNDRDDIPSTFYNNTY